VGREEEEQIGKGNFSFDASNLEASYRARAFPGPNAADAALRASLSAGSDDFDDEVERELAKHYPRKLVFGKCTQR
jgi:hypothetical protein